MVFNLNIREEDKRIFLEKLPISITNKITKYVGLPTRFGRSKVQDFYFILDQLKVFYLSFKGREVSSSQTKFRQRGIMKYLILVSERDNFKFY